MQSASSGGRRLRVLRQAATCDTFLSAELLRRVRQRGRNDVRGRNVNVLLPDPQARRQEQEKSIPQVLTTNKQIRKLIINKPYLKHAHPLFII